MTITNDEAKYFYDLWIPLLDFVNRKYKLIPDLYGMNSPIGLPISQVAIIANKLWDNTSIIDEYIAASACLSEKDISQLKKWKNHSFHDKFIIDRHLKNGSIFISLQTEKVYLVKGLYSSIKEMLSNLPMPQVVEATIIPLNDEIIHDGIMMPYGVTLGRGMSDQSKEIYLSAKSNNSIIKTL